MNDFFPVFMFIEQRISHSPEWILSLNCAMAEVPLKADFSTVSSAVHHFACEHVCVWECVGVCV